MFWVSCPILKQQICQLWNFLEFYSKLPLFTQFSQTFSNPTHFLFSTHSCILSEFCLSACNFVPVFRTYFPIFRNTLSCFCRSILFLILIFTFSVSLSLFFGFFIFSFSFSRKVILQRHVSCFYILQSISAHPILSWGRIVWRTALRMLV